MSGFCHSKQVFLEVTVVYVRENDDGTVKTVKRNQPIERQNRIIKRTKQLKKNIGARTVRSNANEKKTAKRKKKLNSKQLYTFDVKDIHAYKIWNADRNVLE